MANENIQIKISVDGAQAGTALDAVKTKVDALQVSANSANAALKTTANGGVSQMNNALGQLGYGLGDASMFMVNFRMGMMSIGNNIPVVVNGLMQAKKAAEESGGTFKSVLVSSLAGPGGVMVAINGVIMLTQILSTVMQDSGKKAKETAAELEKVADSIVKLKSFTVESLFVTPEGLQKLKDELYQDKKYLKELEQPSSNARGPSWEDPKEAKKRISDLKEEIEAKKLVIAAGEKLVTNEKEKNRLLQILAGASNDVYGTHLKQLEANAIKEAEENKKKLIAIDAEIKANQGNLVVLKALNEERAKIVKEEKKAKDKPEKEAKDETEKINKELMSGLSDLDMKKYRWKVDLLDKEVAKFREAGADELLIKAYYNNQMRKLDEDSAGAFRIDKAANSGMISDNGLSTANPMKLVELTEAQNQAVVESHASMNESIRTMDKVTLDQKLSAIEAPLRMAQQIFPKHTAAYKLFAIAQATMDTYKGANTALATLPPPFGSIMAGMTIAMGLVNVGKIISTKVPAYAKGGYIDSPTYGLIGEAGPEVVAPLGDFQSYSVGIAAAAVQRMQLSITSNVALTAQNDMLKRNLEAINNWNQNLNWEIGHDKIYYSNKNYIDSSKRRAL